MGKRGPAIDRNEIFHFLELIEEIVPIGPVEWDMVESRHRASFPDKMRSKDTIKKKFNQLKHTKPPTGDPHVPEEVKRAKDIWAKIVEKMQGEDGKDILGDDDDEDENFQLAKEEEEEAEVVHETISVDSSKSNDKAGTQTGATQQQILGSKKKRAAFQTPVSRPGAKRPSFNSADETMDSYFKYLVAEQQLERERSEKQIRLQQQQFQMQQQQQQQQFQQSIMQQQQQQFQQMMQFMMMGIMSNNPSFQTAKNFASSMPPPPFIAPPETVTAQVKQARQEVIQEATQVLDMDDEQKYETEND